MRTWSPFIAMTVSLGFLAPAGAQTSRQNTTGSQLTAQDRAEIELSSARYALALGTCAADT
jgi:hypothetical protein